MTRQSARAPLTLLCYGFVLVWTQNVTLDTTTTLEDLSTPFSHNKVKIITGGNFSVSVAPWESTTEPPVVSTQSSLAIHNTTAKDSITIPLPTTLTTSGPKTSVEDELISAVGSTRAPMANTAANGLTGRPRSSTELEMPEESSTGVVADKNGIPASPSVKVSTGTAMAGSTTDTVATSTGVRVSRNLSAPLMAMKKTSTGGKLIWRVKLQSRLSREDAVRTFYEKVCSAIIQNLHVKDISISGAPGVTPLHCT